MQGGEKMSVILGYQTDNKIYLAADNRAYTVETGTTRDNENKIVVINDNVAVACCGFNGTQKLFERMLELVKSKDDFRTDDALSLLKRIYWFCKIFFFVRGTKKIINISSRFIVAGKNKKNEFCMYTISYVNGKLEKPSITKRFMFPPPDVPAKECLDIYAMNAINHEKDFVQKTIKDIAKKGKFVSPSGDIWTYDTKLGCGSIEHFE